MLILICLKKLFIFFVMGICVVTLGGTVLFSSEEIGGKISSKIKQ